MLCGDSSAMVFSATRLTGTIITVCDDDETSCKQCGITSEVGQAEWASVKCTEPIKGSVVKFLTPKNYFQACEIEIYGESKHLNLNVICIQTSVMP